MNRRQNAHRRNTHDTIMAIMRENQGVWMSSNEVAQKIRISQARSIGKHLNYLCSVIDGLEMCIETHTNYRLFRYTAPEFPEVEEPAAPMEPSGPEVQK